MQRRVAELQATTSRLDETIRKYVTACWFTLTYARTQGAKFPTHHLVACGETTATGFSVKCQFDVGCVIRYSWASIRMLHPSTTSEKASLSPRPEPQANYYVHKLNWSKFPNCSGLIGDDMHGTGGLKLP